MPLEKSSTPEWRSMMTVKSTSASRLDVELTVMLEHLRSMPRWVSLMQATVSRSCSSSEVMLGWGLLSPSSFWGGYRHRITTLRLQNCRRIDDEDDMEWDGRLILVFAGIHGGSKINATVHAIYPEYIVKNHRACKHVRNENLNDCRMMNRVRITTAARSQCVEFSGIWRWGCRL